MFELIAQGGGSEYRWRRSIPDDVEFELGRATAPWSIHWDSSISRRHVAVRLRGEELTVRKLESATNPVFFKGEAANEFSVRPGEHFVIGTTTLSLIESHAFATQDLPDPVRQQTFSHDYLRELPYLDANHRMQILNRIPSIISSAGDSEVLLNQFSRLLLTGINRSTVIGVVVAHPGEIEIPHWDGQTTGVNEFQPSESLIRNALSESETVLHIWGGQHEGHEFTLDQQNDWAFVIPLNGEACRDWGVYVSGKHPTVNLTPDAQDLDLIQDDIKFAELVSATFANVLELKSLERRQTSLRPFFAPVVLEAMKGQDPNELLTPRECPVTVMFCDLRGFSKTSEEMAGDLIGLLDRVSKKLGIMTGKILKTGGVVGDFHGDAAMGFWGWPLENQDLPNDRKLSEAAKQSARAAALIRDELRQTGLDWQLPDSSDALAIGMGIASGNAVVGKIGTADQVKVTAFGPVVNLASRLEGLTRLFGNNVLLDERTAELIGEDSAFATRRLCRVRPFGLETEYLIFELLSEPGIESHLEHFSAALLHFENGDWPRARQIFKSCPREDNAAKFFLDYMNHHGPIGPGWNGVIVADSK